MDIPRQFFLRIFQRFSRIFAKFRRQFLLFVIAGVIASLIGGGLRSALLAQNAAPDPITLSVLVGAQEIPVWETVVEPFEAEHPNIRIDLVEGPVASNLREDMYTSAFLLGDSPYDLIYMDVVWVPKFAAAGWLQDLSSEFSPEVQAEFLDGDLDGGRYSGGIYRMPLRSDAGMLYYRKDLLDRAGVPPPETFEDLLTAAQKVQQTGAVDWGFVWQGKQYEGLAAMFVEILAGHGAYWVDPDTRAVGLDSPEAIAAVKFLQSTMDSDIAPPGVTTYQEEETRRIFQNGGSAFLRNWPYVWSLANDPESPVKGKIALKPMVHAPGQRSGACLGGWGLGIAQSSKHKAEAWQAVEYFAGEAAQKQVTLETGYLPTRRSLYKDATVVEKYPHFPAMLEVLENAALRPPIAQYAQASDILQRYLSAALTNRMTPERAMQAAAQETRQLLGQQ